MTQPLSVAFSRDLRRAAFRLFHEKGNILTADMIAALRSALESAAENPRLRLITIEGAGADFSFGASIPEHAPAQIARVLPEMHALVLELLDVPVPTAAIVRGRCFGGGFELALACDFIFAEDAATFALPEVALGVFPPAASALLPVRAGQAAAARAIITGGAVPARAWQPSGLVDVAPPDVDLHAYLDAWYDRHLAGKSASALRHAAAAARLSLAAHVRNVLPKLERLYLDDLMRTHDAVEGIDAFLGKRPPVWMDR